MAGYPGATSPSGEDLAIPVQSEQMVPELLAQFGNRLTAMRYEAPTLEGVFLSLTGRALRDRADGGRDAQRAAGKRGGRR